MDGNTREFEARVTGYELRDIQTGSGGTPVAANVWNEITFEEGWWWGSSFDVPMTGSPDEARSLVGRRVRVTVEVLDG